MTRKSLLAGALLLAASCLPARAGPNDGPKGAAAPPAADGDLGTAILGGDVAADGTLTRAVGATAAGLISGATGAYEVVFVRDVSTCLYSVTPYQASIAYAQTRFDNNSAVFVQMFDRSGTQANGRFHLIVYCGR